MSEEHDFTVRDRRAGHEADQPAGEQAGTATGPCGCGKAKGEDSGGMLPAVTFSTFVLSLSSSALVHLGEVPSPDTGAMAEDLSVARHTIDVLAMLKEKTDKCLDEDERQLLDAILYELRMKYVMKTA